MTSRILTVGAWRSAAVAIATLAKGAAMPLLFILLSAFVSTASAATKLEFILDASRSMQNVHAGAHQIDAAREALLNTISELPPDTQIAVRVSGHRIEASDKSKSCRDSELLIPFGPADRKKLSKRISKIEAKGYSPLAYSIMKSQADFPKTRDQQKALILITDGQDACPADPIMTLKRLQRRGFNIPIFVVAYNVDTATRKTLEELTKMSGGRYFDAKEPDTLLQSTTQAAFAALAIQKKVPLKKADLPPAPIPMEPPTVPEVPPIVPEQAVPFPRAPGVTPVVVLPGTDVATSDKSEGLPGQPIQGGKTYDKAVPLEFSKDYRLDHHQGIGYFDYFIIELSPEDEMVLELRSLEKGINLRGDTPKETETPYAGASLYDGQEKKLGSLSITGTKNDVKRLSHNPREAGQYYIVIGTTYDDMHKDHTSFRVIKIIHGDLNTGVDAGESMSQPMRIKALMYEENYLGGTDSKDVFSFKANKGDAFFIGLIPNEDSDGQYTLTVYDNYKQKVLSQTSGVNEGIKSEAFSIPETGIYFIEITLESNLSKAVSYSLELRDINAKKEAKEAPKAKKAVKKKQQSVTKPAPQKKKSKASKKLSDDLSPLARPTPTKLPDLPEPTK